MSKHVARIRPLRAVVLVLAVALAGLPATAGAEQEAAQEIGGPDAHSVVTLDVPDQATMIAVVDGGFDLEHNVERVGEGFTVNAYVTDAEIAALGDLGVGVDTEATPAEAAAQHAALQEQREEALEQQSLAALDAGVEEVDTVVIARADYYQEYDSEFISVEAKSTDGTDATLTIEWDAGPGTEIGDGGSATLSTFVDAGQYMYHRGQFELGAQAVFTIDSGSGAGDHAAVGASFGPSLDTDGVSGNVELVDDGSANPTEGCDPLVDFTAGNIALVDRGNCPFVQKAQNAEAAGATAMIVANNLDGAPFAMSGNCGSCTIPAAMISQADGATIKAGLPTTGTIAVLPPKPAPERVRVTSSLGGSAEADFEEWLPTDFPPRGNRYFEGFLEHYPDSYELTEAIEDLAAEFPDLAEVVELPYLTDGYRRPAQALIGTTTSNAVGVESHSWGHEGGNDLSIAFVDPGGADSDLSVSVDGDDITVSLATGGEGELASTAAEVVDAINGDDDASDLILAYTYRGNDGDDTAVTGEEDLTDGLEAPEHVLREPFQVKMLRIGKQRDGSKTGVLLYSAEHAREWQTPLVQIEVANRLLHNYATDHKTRQLVNNMDIFLVPVVNPDGHLYSYYDFGFQRRNMKRYCEVGQSNDINAQDGWGVDVNRNYTAYSRSDGYSGASGSCTSDVFQGPGELSEAESSNMDWIAAAFPNINFAINLHSYGEYFMWSPGSYATPGRISAPRPSFGSETFFFEMAEAVLTRIKEHRANVITPARTGPVADVLYSAAGNSGDMMWYDYGIFAFSFEAGTSFQPSFADGAGSEAWHQMMEFANGEIELIEQAMQWTRDRYAPTSWINEDISEPSDGPVGITFGFSEPVEIYYTTDGSNPTTDSAQYDFAGIREGGETLWFEETTTIKWFSVDMAGNVEGKYHPTRNNANTATIVIND